MKWLRERKGTKLKARLFKDDRGEYRFRLIGGNGEPLDQSEGYANEADARATIRLIEQATQIEILEEDR